MEGLSSLGTTLHLLWAGLVATVLIPRLCSPLSIVLTLRCLSRSSMGFCRILHGVFQARASRNTLPRHRPGVCRTGTGQNLHLLVRIPCRLPFPTRVSLKWKRRQAPRRSQIRCTATIFTHLIAASCLIALSVAYYSAPSYHDS